MNNRVVLGDLVNQIKDKVDKDNTSLEYYVGGEHIDSQSRVIKRKGKLEGSTIGSAFKMRFKPGDVLLMSRNPHLCKASMADFEGICSDVSYVCRTKDDEVFSQRLLPFLMQTNAFWRHAEKNKRGGMPFFLNWKDFATFEFNLPPIEAQERLADILWAAEETKAAYEDQIAATDELVKSQFIELFGDYKTNSKGWPIASFNDFAKIDANMTTDYEFYADYPHIGIDSIEKDTGVLAGYRTVKEDNVISGKYVFTSAHIIYSKIRPNLNKVALPEFDGVCSADAYPILPNVDNCNRLYLAVLLRSEFFLDYILGFSARSNMPKVNRKQVEGFKAPLPPLALQEQFAAFYKQSDKSKFELKQSIEKIDAVIKSLSEQTFA